MMRSMFAGVSGVRSHQVMMDVVGNNIANVNTTGFKASRVLFVDALSQVIRGATGGAGEATAGINPQQVGLGVRVGSTDLIYTQGALQLTGRATDVAVQGDGFFLISFGGEELYTRMGSFSFDQQGLLTDNNGGVIRGWNADEQGRIDTLVPVGNIQVPIGSSVPPVSTTEVMIGGNLSSNAAVGDRGVTAIDIVDNTGIKQRVSYEFEKTALNEWTLRVFDSQTPPVQIGNAGGYVLEFDGSSGFLNTVTPAPSVTFTPPGASDPVTFTMNFGTGGSAGAISQYGGPGDVQAHTQNGSEAGFLRAFAIADDGVLSGVFSNGRTRPLAQLALASFTNPSGLLKTGESRYRPTRSSGDALVGTSGTGGRGRFAAGALEMSNVELSQEFTNLIIAQRGFQANSRVISTSDEMIQDLVNLKR